MTETQSLLREIEAFCAGADMSPSYFGKRAVNDGKLVKRLRDGRQITMAKAEAVRRFIASRRPTPTATAAA